MAQLKVIVPDDNGQERNTHIQGLGDGLLQLNTMEQNIDAHRL